MSSSTPNPDREPKSFLAWQWRQYSTAHRDRTNLLVHAATAPLFVAGSCALLASPWAAGAWRLAVAAAGLLAMMIAMAAQGRTHRLEAGAPAPFRGPLDVLVRIAAEQWITFPRYVLTGAFLRAWRASGRRSGVPAPAARAS